MYRITNEAMPRVMSRTREKEEVFPEELAVQKGCELYQGAKAERPLFIIHPSKRDGDRLESARGAIQGLIDQRHAEMRIVLIAPPAGSVYLRKGTSVDKVRTSARTSDWILPEDLIGVTRLALAGGNLELCLADALNEVKHVATPDSYKAPIQVDLPLNAIYSRQGLTAAQLFNTLKGKSNELLAAVSILTSKEQRVNYGVGIAHGDISVISPEEAVAYEFQINGQDIGAISPKCTIEVRRTIRINLELSDTEPVEASEALDGLCTQKIDHTIALLDKYQVT